MGKAKIATSQVKRLSLLSMTLWKFFDFFIRGGFQDIFRHRPRVCWCVSRRIVEPKSLAVIIIMRHNKLSLFQLAIHASVCLGRHNPMCKPPKIIYNQLLQFRWKCFELVMERTESKEMRGKIHPPENKYCVTKKLNSSNPPTLLVTTFEKAFLPANFLIRKFAEIFQRNRREQKVINFSIHRQTEIRSKSFPMLRSDFKATRIQGWRNLSRQ